MHGAKNVKKRKNSAIILLIHIYLVHISSQAYYCHAPFICVLSFESETKLYIHTREQMQP